MLTHSKSVTKTAIAQVFPALPKKEKRDRAFLFYDGSHAKISKPTF